MALRLSVLRAGCPKWVDQQVLSRPSSSEPGLNRRSPKMVYPLLDVPSLDVLDLSYQWLFITGI